MSGINIELLDVGSFCEGKYMLQMHLWDKKLKKKWNFINVYGAAQEENKNDFLEELAKFCAKNNDPLIIGGDFNLIRFISEKNKNTGLPSHSGVFNSIIASYELIDLQLSGGKYTWSNNQTDATLEKLDRFLVTKDWEALFPRVIVYKLPREISDHNPIILSSKDDQPLRNLMFRFELSWVKHPDFSNLVKQIWEKPCHANSAFSRIQIKLKRFEQYFKGWSFNAKGEQKKI